MAEPRGPAQCLRGALYLYLINLLHIYINGSSALPIWEGVTDPLIRGGLINPTDFINFFRVGLSPTQCFKRVGDVADGGPLDRRRIGRSTRRSCGCGPLIAIKARA